MPKLNANLTMMFNEFDFLDRFKQARQQGFQGVEILFPYEYSLEKIKTELLNNKLELVLFNMPPGDFKAGDRGLACIPTRVSEFRDSVQAAISYAVSLNCKKLHCMAGLKPSADTDTIIEETFIENIRFAADACRAHNINVLIEPINNRDMPGYFLNYSRQATRLIEAIDRPNVGLQYDIYHMQIMEGDLAPSIESLLPQIKHMQLADTPGRHEPGTGEINYSFLLSIIDTLGYDGWIGCEYRPQKNTISGLDWIKPYL
jgi:hydroxypyruvate isomerase